MASTSALHQHPVPAREVTEDTPVDHLEGTMDLLVILPSKKSVRMTVNRRTPIMDLLVQVTTANKINPGGHIVQVRNELGRELQYKPSTPIGTLDTRTIEILPKHQVSDYIIVKKQQPGSKVSTHPFEHTFRLQVHLPRNQLYVMRVGPKTLLQDILEEVCQEKNLDIAKYEIRHPVNLDEKLSLTNRLGDYGLQQVRVVSKNSRITSSVSSADILALQQSTNGGRTQGLDSAFNYSRSSVGESSLSSGSARGTSPSRSDDSRSISPVGILPSKIKLKSSLSNVSNAPSGSPLQAAMLRKSISSNPLPTVFDGELKPKKRAPPPPPHRTVSQTTSQPMASEKTDVKAVLNRKEVPAPVPPSAAPSHSRNSSASDSSGYHEASASSILSDQRQEITRNDRLVAGGRKAGTGSLSSLTNPPPSIRPFEMSTSTSNLTSGLSVSTTSIASSGGTRQKRKAPKPPVAPSLQAPFEQEEESQPLKTTLQGPEREPVEVEVEVHASSRTPQEPLDETEKGRPSTIGNSSISNNESPNKGGTLKGTGSELSESTSCSTCSSTSGSGSTLAKSGESGTGSRSSLTKSPPSMSPSPPLPEEPSRHSPVVSGIETSLSPSTSPQANSLLTNTQNPPPIHPRMKRPQPVVDLPQPKPRPRSVKLSQRPIKSENEPPPPVPRRTSNHQDSLSNESEEVMRHRRFGVKVLPDKALQNPQLPESRMSPTSDPPSSNSHKRETRGERHETSVSGMKLKSSDMSPNASKPQADPSMLESIGQAPALLTGNLPSLNALNDSNKLSKPQIHKRRPSVRTSDDDSDNLEQNLELFEPHGSETSSRSDSESEKLDSKHTLIRRFGSETKIREEDDGTDTYSTGSVPPKPRPIKSSAQIRSNGSLNRWKNVESLELNHEGTRRGKTLPSSVQTIIPNKTNQLPLMTFTKDKKFETNSLKTKSEPGSGDKHEEASSGSEASYADSGLPATATVTPSPVSLEHDVQDHHSNKSLNSSRRSSIHSGDSDHSECWRELLESKVEEQGTEKALEFVFSGLRTGSPPNLDEKSGIKPEHLSNPNFSSGPVILPDLNTKDEIGEIKENRKSQSSSPTLQGVSLPTSNSEKNSSLPSSEDESSSRTEKKRGSKSSETSSVSSVKQRSLTKSDSFSHNSEYDGKKRRNFSSATPQRRLGSLKSSTYSSSSDEEDVGRQMKPNPKSTSMQNLSHKEKSKIKDTTSPATVVSRRKSREVESDQFQKSASLIGMPNLITASPQALGITNDSKLLETFQAELEQQFEHWKEQFLKRHLSSTSPTDSKATNQQNSEETGIPPTEPSNPILSRQSSSSISVDVSGGEEEDIDPEKPQAVYSVRGVEPVSTDTELKFVPSLEENRKTETDMNSGPKDVKIREKRGEKQAPPAVYRYSGPPSIHMGTWGERPQRSITVKEDNDYIMGMGQQDAKTSVAARIHGFRGTSPVSNNVSTTSTLPRRAPSPNTSRWSNIEIKSDETNVNRPSVIASWKQRVEEGEKNRKESLQTASPSVDVKIEPRRGSHSSTLESPRSITSKPSFTISSASSTLERPIGKRTTSPLFTNAQAPPTVNAAVSIGKVAPKESPKEVKLENGTYTGLRQAQNGNNVLEKRNSISSNSLEDKKRIFQGTKADQTPREVSPKGIHVRTSTYGESRKLTNEVKIEDTVDASQSRSTSSASSSSFGSFDSSTPNGISMEEKKRFFQGVKPCESPTREVPLPAVNMKSSIATISRVFEKQNSIQKSSSFLSLASNSSSNVPSPSVSTTPSPHSSVSRKGGNELIGARRQSDLMVQQVFKGNSNVGLSMEHRKSVVATENGNSQEGGTVRISTSATTPVFSSAQTYGNKAIIVVGTENESTPVNANYYKQQLKVNGTDSGHSVKISVNSSSSGDVPAQKQSRVILNATKLQSSSPSKASESITIEETKKQPTKSKIQEMQSILGQQKLNFVPPPPPPPLQQPLAQQVQMRPSSLNGLGKSSSELSNGTGSGKNSGKGSTPVTPSSPMEARAGILTAIKNSGGNFGLKKTRSSMLLK